MCNHCCSRKAMSIVRLKRDGTRAETRFCLSPKRTSPLKSVGASVQLTAGSQGLRISVSNAGYATLQGSVRVLATHSIRQLPLHFPSRASPCAIRFQTHSNTKPMCVSVALVIQHVKRMRRIILSSVTCPALPYFSTVPHK